MANSFLIAWIHDLIIGSKFRGKEKWVGFEGMECRSLTNILRDRPGLEGENIKANSTVGQKMGIFCAYLRKRGEFPGWGGFFLEIFVRLGGDALYNLKVEKMEYPSAKLTARCIGLPGSHSPSDSVRRTASCGQSIH